MVLKSDLCGFFRARFDEPMAISIDRSAFDPSGRRTDRWDPRLWAAAEAGSDTSSNLRNVHSLSGKVLLSDSADAGCTVELPGEAGPRFCCWDAKDQSQRIEYDGLLRPIAIFEHDGSQERCAERLTHGGADLAQSNHCGRLVRHDDPQALSSMIRLRLRAVSRDRCVDF